jgi:hypothetical protein
MSHVQHFKHIRNEHGEVVRNELISDDSNSIAMKASRPSGSDLRHDIPAIAPPPDRRQWLRDHGKAPYRIIAEERFVNQAKAIVERDYTTLLRDRAISQHTKLEHVCEVVKQSLIAPRVQLEPTDACAVALAEQMDRELHVFFDPQDGAFWVYPE